MAEAYATFAAQGKHCASRAITAIEDSAGHLLKEYPSRCTQVLEANVANTVNDILKGVMEPGGFGSAISTVQQDAGKTGTTQDGKSVWFVGYTPNLATAAMIAGANQEGQPIPLAGQTVGGSFIASRLRVRHRRSDVGRRDERDRAVARRCDVHPAVARAARGRSPPPCPTPTA